MAERYRNTNPPHVVDDVELELMHPLCSSLGETRSRFSSRDDLARDLRREQDLAKPLRDDVNFVTVLGYGDDKLPAPFLHAAASRVEFVDDYADSHNFRLIVENS